MKASIKNFISKDKEIAIIRGEKCLCKTIDIMRYIKHEGISLNGINGFDIYEICGDVAYDDLKVDYYDHKRRIGYFIIKNIK